MKASTVIFLLFTFVFSASVHAQKSLKVAGTEACNCLKNNRIGAGDINDDEALVSTCLQEALLNNLSKISAEYDVDLTDEEAGYKLGVELGKVMIVECKEFMDYSIKVAEEERAQELKEEEKTKSPESTITGTSSGQFEKIENKDFAFIYLKSSEGRRLTFLWLRYFQGSEALIETPKALSGKKVTIQWREIEVYLPSLKEYFTQKEILHLEIH